MAEGDGLRTAGRIATAAAAKAGLGFWGWVVGLVGGPMVVGGAFIAAIVFVAAMMGAQESGSSDDEAIAAVETTCQPDGESNIPEKYRDDVAQAAKESGWPAPMIAAQIDQESGWREDAYNAGSKAAGMTQFIPSTWESVMGNADPYDGHLSVKAQGIYMGQLRAEMKKHFNLSDDDPKLVDYTLAAYNAGPGRVRQQNGVPTLKGDLKTPNTETPAYVKSIKTMAQNKYSKSCKIETVGVTTGEGKNETVGDVGSGKWVNPTPGGHITPGNGFGPRACPFSSCVGREYLLYHEGADIGGITKSLAATDMEILHVSAGPGDPMWHGYGWYFTARQIEAPHYYFEYHEGSRVTVKKGQKVAAGEVVMEHNGTSGTSTGSHLHFQINKPETKGMDKPMSHNGWSVDPIAILKKAGAWK